MFVVAAVTRPFASTVIVGVARELPYAPAVTPLRATDTVGAVAVPAIVIELSPAVTESTLLFATERALEAVVEAVVAVAWRFTQSVAVSVGKTFNFAVEPATCATAVVPSKPRVAKVMTPVEGLRDVHFTVSSVTRP